MPDAVDRFVELWNAGSVEKLRPIMAEGYTYAEPMYPGPYDADGHIALMREVADRVPDRRLVDVRRVPGGTRSVALSAEWVGTMGDSEMRLQSIFAFDVNEDASLIERLRCFYPVGGS